MDRNPTGKTDSKGKPIYTGDIIRFSIKGKGLNWVTGIVEVDNDDDDNDYYFAGRLWGDIIIPPKERGFERDDEVIGSIFD